MPVGKGETEESFKTYSINVQEGDVLYLFTDGYPDQFGGPKGKKYKYKQLDELLTSIHELELHSTKEKLLLEFNNWKGFRAG
ncbi:MAG: SpoIIE family protein phosphatase [Bacteroidetes bacterium]|nr:SpoIIE family protein phosphatase [Bacteroidota bacterium]